MLTDEGRKVKKQVDRAKPRQTTQDTGKVQIGEHLEEVRERGEGESLLRHVEWMTLLRSEVSNLSKLQGMDKLQLLELPKKDLVLSAV